MSSHRDEAIYHQWYNDPRTVRKMMDELVVSPTAGRCPTCHVPFDKGKRRRITEDCGHERCYYCMLNADGPGCPICAAEAAKAPSNQSRPRMKTNGHFTTFMQTRNPHTRGPPASGMASPKISHISWKDRKMTRPSTVSVDNHNALSDDEFSQPIYHQPYQHRRPPPPSVVPPPPPLGGSQQQQQQHASEHLYTRLGLLLGEGPPASTAYVPPAGSSNHSQGSFASVSSLANSDINMAGSNNTSPISTLTGSSEAEAMSILRGSSREESSDSVASLMSTSSSPSPSRKAPFQQRNNSVPSNRRGTPLNCSNKPQTFGHARGVQLHYKISLQPALKPLFFEVPQADQDPPFVGRQWLFDEIDQELQKDNSKGVVIVGCPGSGKTAAILQLVDYSTFGRKKEEVTYGTAGVRHCEPERRGALSSSNTSVGSGSASSVYQPRLSAKQDGARCLGGHLVAYHFCQADNNVTCLVPEFVHSVAAQLCQAPQLVAYRDLLLRDQRLQDVLSISSCQTDPHEALVKGILEPLSSLRQTGRIPNTSCIIVVDALNEAELHRPDYGDTITSFLARHILKFPAWLKLIVTVRTAFQEVTQQLPFHQISLDRMSCNENLMRDIVGYVLFRIESSPSARANITVNNGKQDGSTHARFANHLANLSKGCFLYAKLTMDLIERGHLVVKSSSYKVLPVSLSEVYLLNFNLKFTTTRAFERVQSLLQVCMASLYPLRPHELYHSVNASATYEPMTWADFQQRLTTLTSAQFMMQRNDDSLMLAHPSLREWLIRRDENDSTKFLCDVRAGHASIALRMSRIEAPLDPSQLLELGHHILKAHIYKNISRGLPQSCAPRDLQALWVFQSAGCVSSALVAPANLYSPNVKVSRLLLLAQADPNARTNCLNRAPLLVLSAYEGFTDMVTSLVEFGADVNVSSDVGRTALSMACQRGHFEIAKYLLSHGARIDHVDSEGLSALAYAASSGHLDLVMHLVQCKWPDDFGIALGLHRAAQQALITAAKSGHIEVCEFLLNMMEVQVNKQDDFSGHTALTAASLAGHRDVCALLMRRGASALVRSNAGEPPLCCAVREGHWAVTELLLCHARALEQADALGRSPLMLAAAEGHLGVLELLLAKGANLLWQDKDGLSALSWACSRGQAQAAQCLLTHGADINHSDKKGRTPLDMAATQGNAEVIKLLLNNGAEIEHVDLNGTRALDRAIGTGNLDAINCFLQAGAKIGSQTWEMAADKPDVVHLLLNKLHQDGALLYRKGHMKDAVHRYQYALKKFPASVVEDAESGSIFLQLKHQLLLGLAKCKRKLNEPDAAISAATQAIELRPKSFEGHFIRAKAYKDKGCQAEAQANIEEALRLAPISNIEQRRTLLKVQEEIGAGDLDLTGTQYMSTRSSLDNQSNCTDSMDQVCGISVDSRLNLASVHL